MKKLYVAMLGSILALSLVSCNSESDSTSETDDNNTSAVKETTDNKDENTGSEEITSTGEVENVTIKGTNFEFDTKEAHVKAGNTIKLTYENENGAHGMAIDEFDVDVKGGESIEFVADKKGEFEYYCSVLCGTGHDNMAGKFIVE